MAVVLLMISLMTGFLLQVFDTGKAVDCYTDTRQQMRDINRAIEKFTYANSRLPFPARMEFGSSNPSFGIESSSGHTSVTVTGDNVLIGMLPHATLGLGSAYASDCWGNKFRYAVTEKLTSNSTSVGYPSSSVGKIAITTNPLNAPTTVLTAASYVVVSAGMNGTGATQLTASDTVPASCVSSSTSRIDTENCDPNAVFATAPFNNGTADQNYFDDVIVFGQKPPAINTNLYCWGQNSISASNHGDDGLLGDGTTTNRTKPTKVYGTVQFAKVFTPFNFSTGSDNAPHVTCGIAVSGEAYCWGWNSDGSVGDGTTTARNVPTLVAGGQKFQDIQVSYNGTLGNKVTGLTTGGKIYVWGKSDDSNFGLGSSTTTRVISTPTLIDHGIFVGKTFTKIQIPDRNGCALTNTGHLICWGRNCEGQLARGDVTCTPSFNTIPDYTFSDFVMRNYTVCGIVRSDNLLHPRQTVCWGSNTNGTLGRNLDPVVTRDPFPIPVSGGHHFVELVMSPRNVMCGRLIDGTTYCWGYGIEGQMGNGATADGWVPTEVSGTSNSTSAAGTWKFKRLMAAPYRSFCGVTYANELYCWGYAGGFALGDGTSLQKNFPVRIGGTMIVADVNVVGTGTNCLISNNGEHYCWGYQPRAHIGDGSTTNRASPTKSCPSGDATCDLRFRYSSSNGYVSCAILGTPSLCAGVSVGGYCWYKGNAGANCTAVCATHGGYHEATRSFAGSDGTLANCELVVSAFGVASPSTMTGTTAGTGCSVHSLDLRVNRNTSPTTEGAAEASLARICACSL